MQTLNLDSIFIIYEEEFYRYLVPYVVNDLRDKNASEIFWGNNELNVRFKNIINESVEQYFEYLFPITVTPSSTNIQYFKEQTLEKIHKYLAAEGYYVSIFEHVQTGDKPTEVIDPKTNNLLQLNTYEFFLRFVP